MRHVCCPRVNRPRIWFGVSLAVIFLTLLPLAAAAQAPRKLLPAHFSDLTGTWEFTASQVSRGLCSEEKTEVWLLTLVPHPDGRRLEGLLTRSDTIRATFLGTRSKAAQDCFSRQFTSTAEYIVTVDPRASLSGCEAGCIEAALVTCNGDCRLSHRDRIVGPFELRTTEVLKFDDRRFSRRE